jgi:hypothetical protein
MRQLQITAALCAFLLIGAIAAQAAVAGPSYKTCAKTAKVGGKYTGQFTDKKCSVPATPAEEAEGKKNKYSLGEWNQGKEAAPKFKGSNGPSKLVSFAPGFGVVGEVTCTSAKNEGHITGPSEGNVTVEFEHCTAYGEPCSSAGEGKGKIKTATLSTELFDTAEASSGVATRVAGSPVIAEFTCTGGVDVVTSGAADGEDTGNIGSVQKEYEQVFAVNAGDEQLITDAGQDLLTTEIKGVGTVLTAEDTTAKLKGEEMEIEP